MPCRSRPLRRANSRDSRSASRWRAPLYPWDGVLKGGCAEAGEIADRGRAEVDERTLASEPRVAQAIVQERQPGEVLVLLAVGHLAHRGLGPRAAERLDDRLAVE